MHARQYMYKYSRLSSNFTALLLLRLPLHNNYFGFITYAIIISSGNIVYFGWSLSVHMYAIGGICDPSMSYVLFMNNNKHAVSTV